MRGIKTQVKCQCSCKNENILLYFILEIFFSNLDQSGTGLHNYDNTWGLKTWLRIARPGYESLLNSRIIQMKDTFIEIKDNFIQTKDNFPQIKNTYSN